MHHAKLCYKVNMRYETLVLLSSASLTNDNAELFASSSMLSAWSPSSFTNSTDAPGTC